MNVMRTITLDNSKRKLEDHDSSSESQHMKALKFEKALEKTVNNVTLYGISASQTKLIFGAKNSSCDKYTKCGACPDSIAREALKSLGYVVKVRPALSIHGYFYDHTQEDIAAYNCTVIAAVKSNNIDVLRTLHGNGQSMRACNTFGESILHLACRRGFKDIVKFFIKEANVSLKICDDFGRTPLHDACWTTEPSFDLVDLIIEEEPDLVFISDKRGHTPFNYVRRQHWLSWSQFIRDRSKNLSKVPSEEP